MKAEAISFLETVVQCDPNDVEARVMLGWLYEYQRHDYDGAVAHLKAALSKNPQSAQAGFWLAKVYFHDGSRLELACQALEDVLRVHPDHVPSLSLLASVYCDLGERELAIEALERALELAPSWVSLHTEAAMRYADVGTWDVAAKHAAEALRLAREFRKVSDSETYTYFEAAVTGRWVTDEDIARLKHEAARAQRAAGAPQEDE